MADYHPLIARAVAGLDKNTGEARRALYERARTALVTQLRGVEPALSETDITRERLALEEAIRKVEAEAARRPRQESPEPPATHAVPPLPRFERPASSAAAPPPPPPPPPPEAEFAEPPPADWVELQRELDSLASPETLQPPEYRAAAAEPPLPFGGQPQPGAAPAPDQSSKPPSWAPAVPPRRSEQKVSGERGSLVDEGLKGFRDVIAETDDLGRASASASKSARDTREAFTTLPPALEIERIEPQMMEPNFGPEDLIPAEQEFPQPRPEPHAGRQRRAPAPASPREFEELDERHLRPGGRNILRAILLLAVVLGLGAAAFFAYREWGGGIAGLLQSARAPTTQTSPEASQTRPKISDRVGGTQQETRPGAGAATAVAQRAILYELGGGQQERKQYVGSAIWRTETASPGPGQPADMAVKATVEIPERQMRLDFTLRRNLDKSLPASHTLEVALSTPPDFPPGGIADVPGVLLEDNERSGAVPLSGLRVKVTTGFFLFGLDSSESLMRRNVRLLKERPWLQIRMVYNNGQGAVLAVEKGVPGDRAFEEALNAWGQNPPPEPR